jgi:type II secretory pathway pseudopilin PulG
VLRDRTSLIDSPHPASCQRRGSLLFEVGVAAALLATVMSVLIPVLARTSEKRAQINQRELALETVANLLERAALVPQPTHETLQPIADQLTRPDELPAPEWNIVVTTEQNPAMNRVEATLSWQSRPLIRHSVTLVRWYTGETP